ncbi:uncharacterized protein MELLADRAFT_58919 [Melampsora larici-populina 98AG31]|uniref:Uncharacterized protein n=1 Tax=Melampsora larici-populina (strain 98AG31 / pathotype 3-4-7) TaxID=747676 RepID=F4R6E8_MELLP|nr:uncharacterized protein MELLADRAFT_58919 [Melampsora larici-populina 98AG31]EGG12474.1 hypothetical protein MELLADRAFT_58919 [Melampsora larici-populina 98AG31]
MSRIGKLTTEPSPDMKRTYPQCIPVLTARLKIKAPSFFSGEYAFRNFTVFATHMAGSSQTIIRFYVLWQLVIVQSHLNLSLDPYVIPYGMALSSSLVTLMIQTLVQVSLLGRAQKLDRIATYSAALATERDEDGAASLSLDSHSIGISTGDDDIKEWAVALRNRRLITHSQYLHQGSSIWRWKALQCLIAIGPFENNKNIALIGTSSSSNDKAARVTAITPIWYMLSAVVDVLISSSTICDLGGIRKQVTNLRNSRNDTSHGDIWSVSQQCTDYFHHSLFHSAREGMAITLIAVLSTSLKSQEARSSIRLSTGPYHLMASSEKRGKNPSIIDAVTKKHCSDAEPPKSLPTAMIRDNPNLSLIYDSFDSRSQSTESSSISQSTLDHRGQATSRTSPISQPHRESTSTVSSNSAYPFQSRFSDWGTATPDNSTLATRSTKS